MSPRVLIIGCGSIGTRHLRNMACLGVKDFVLCDPNGEALKRASEGLLDPTLKTDFNDAIKEKVNAAVIAAPSSMHLDMAVKLAKKGVHLLIEKPLSDSLLNTERLKTLVGKKRIAAMMAMCYRFHPVFLSLRDRLGRNAIGTVYHVNYYGGHYLPDWHPNADYRREYASQARLGGGVVLTSIHGLDNLRWLFGEVITAFSFVDRVGTLEMDVEDIAIAVFRMRSGVYVNWQTDFLQRANQHRMVVTGSEGTIRCDFIEGVIETYCAGSGKWEAEKVAYDVNTMYVEEMRHFLSCVEHNKSPDIDVEEGIKTLKLALEVKRFYGAEAKACSNQCKCSHG